MSRQANAAVGVGLILLALVVAWLAGRVWRMDRPTLEPIPSRVDTVVITLVMKVPPDSLMCQQWDWLR